MQPREARVCIVDDETDKQKRLQAVVKQTGGKVVGFVDNAEDAKALLADDSFPSNINNANVLLVDGSLRQQDKDGLTGRDVVRSGLRTARLHRGEFFDPLGAAAIGCSGSDSSAVVSATGVNFSRPLASGAPEQWSKLLKPHPAEPVYVESGAMVRTETREGHVPVEMMLGHPQTLMSVAKSGADLIVHELFIKGSNLITNDKGEPDRAAVYLDTVDRPTEMPAQSFLQRVSRKFQEGAWSDEQRTADAHRVSGIVEAGEFVYVFWHDDEPSSMHPGRGHVKVGGVDKIAKSAVHQLPIEYWAMNGFPKLIL